MRFVRHKLGDNKIALTIYYHVQVKKDGKNGRITIYLHFRDNQKLVSDDVETSHLNTDAYLIKKRENRIFNFFQCRNIRGISIGFSRCLAPLNSGHLKRHVLMTGKHARETTR